MYQEPLLSVMQPSPKRLTPYEQGNNQFTEVSPQSDEQPNKGEHPTAKPTSGDDTHS
jgi:hypothetical protein